MKLFQDELIKNLPDCYNKNPNSNNYKLMQLIQYDRDRFKEELEDLWNSLDLDKADTSTLNLYGDMVKQQRGLLDDDKYRILIKTKIARNMCCGDYRSIVNCICQILDCTPSDVHIIEKDEPCVIYASQIPLRKIIEADMTATQFTQILKTLLPVGITLDASVYGGTFEFSDLEFEASQTAGFCQNEGDNYGGYLGVLSEEENQTVLPI